MCPYTALAVPSSHMGTQHSPHQVTTRTLYTTEWQWRENKVTLCLFGNRPIDYAESTTHGDGLFCAHRWRHYHVVQETYRFDLFLETGSLLCRVLRDCLHVSLSHGVFHFHLSNRLDIIRKLRLLYYFERTESEQAST